VSIRGRGLGAWLLQRFTAVYLVIMVAYIFVLCLGNDFSTQTQLRQVLSSRFMSISVSLMILAILGHGWVGIRDIVMDYIKPLGLRLVIYACVITYILYIMVWALRILWNI
jgi:succinate dehydrogenase / fumarate reductase membrane anchor subunit